MANISAIKLPNGSTYDLVDKTSGYVTTDNKLEISSVSNGSYYPIVASNSTTAAIRQYDNTGFEYYVSNGTTSTRGYSKLTLGNSISVNNVGNKEGIIRLYGQYNGYVDISLYTYTTSGRTITIPDASGTLALTSNIKDATLTIQKNGVNVETFSANASSNKTANIVVNEVPSGGITGQVLAKNSNTNYDAGWITLPDNGVFLVTFTYDEQNETWSCDKTASQIYEAWEADKAVVGVLYEHYEEDPQYQYPTGHYYCYPLFYCSKEGEEYYAEFSSLVFRSGLSGGHSINKTSFIVDGANISQEIDISTIVPTSRKINNKTLARDITLTASDVGAQEPLVSGTNIKTINNNSILGSGNLNISVPTKTSDLTNDSGFITGMTILSYGSSTWQNFIDAYNANKIVYCRASSNSNPASGSQTRLAFMAYVNNATTPTEVEFQYYRSVSTHTASQQGDQVYVYKLNKTNGWSVTVREASVKVVAGTGLGGTYSNGTMTLTGPTKVSNLTNDSGFITTDDILQSDWNQTTSTAKDYIKNKPTIPTKVSDLTNDSGFITGYTETDPIFTASAAHGITSSDITNWNGKQAALVSGTNIKTINNQSLLGSGNISVISGGTSVPTANETAEFDSSAKMNSTNMTSSEVTDFVESLDISGGGGGSVPTFNTATITLTTAGWSNNSQTVTVQGVTASNIVIVNPAPASYDEYVVDNVRCTGQDANSLTFTCDFVPDETITVSIIITSVTAVYGGEVS